MGEVQVLHLHHRLQILWCRVSGDILAGVTKCCVSITLLTGECFLQLVAGEVTQSTDTNHLIEHLQVRIVGSTVE